jgi:hypothetical protein
MLLSDTTVPAIGATYPTNLEAKARVELGFLRQLESLELE